MNNSNSQYYVGIGASAGGLEALETLFKNMPLETGLIFIVIQHLSPDYKSFMRELLSKHTSIPVQVAEDGMVTSPNNIYLIPPQKNLSIFDGKLILESQSQNASLKLPIDIFFRSLAKDKGSHSIGIVLSGTGSDGSLGIKAIKEAGGITIAQDENTAKFDGMPRSAISTGLVDYVLSPEDISKELLSYTQANFFSDNFSTDSTFSVNMNGISKINMILRNHSGIDFSHYKESTISRRLERRIRVTRCTTLEKYIDFLNKSDKEKEVLKSELLIGVTSFFRDTEAFESISKNVLPNLDYSKNQIRVWTAACSTGEEAYSIAILISEYLEKNNINCDVKIFATDVDKKALEVAAYGYYLDNLLLDIDQSLVQKYFVKKNNGYIIKEKIRKMIVFANHNVLKDPTFSKLDFLTCRNLFIYFKSEKQQKVLENFYYSLLPNGFLFLGSSESIGEMSSALKTIDFKWKIFQKTGGYYPIDSKPSVIQKEDNILFKNTKLNSFNDYPPSVKIDRLLSSVLAVSMPPSIIIDSYDNIVHVINNVSSFLETQPGRFSKNLNSNMKKDLSIFVNNLLRKLKTNKHSGSSFETVSIIRSDDSLLTLKGYSLRVHDSNFFLVSFIKEKHVTSSKSELVDYKSDSNYLIKQLESELVFAKEGLQATIEELETSNEELQSSNEELIAANEELQSTNEELQSVNEELYTVNNEYQNKIEELSKLNSDLNNLIKNTSTGALYLDKNLCIRKVTPIVSQITNIRDSDIGRPISHLSFMENYEGILEDLNKVLDTLEGIEKEIIDSDNNTWLARLKPYRTEHNSIDGIILTFVNITTMKNQEKKLDKAQSRLSMALDAGNIAWWEYDVQSGNVVFSDKKATMLGYTVEEFPTYVYDVCDLIHPDDYDSTMKKMENHLLGITDSWDALYRIRRKDGGYSWYHDRGKISLWTKDKKPHKVIGTVTDVTHIKNLEIEMQEYKDEKRVD
ncbi:two-component system CheB/CheR fusion protein [Acetoanaerobium pronyense]|uniref:protein-glutamate O-methyltransferase n=1 Tax=Acetoanaerobium pronyense TaxID=1482736 RepID=A0ABS4KH70_9FIRM|nr:chemotaxis protein CheB [Acetoanaerobium pronyense]MBP2027098.1 two-component system CheB/CheR fusion protein [Acetoanaerobium pronyense]